MDRNIPYLLNKYYYKDKRTEKLANGELWATEHAVKNMKEQLTYEKLNTLETIVTERATKTRGRFKLPKAQKDRARYIIKHLDFRLGPKITEEQFIVMIIVYVKLESNPNARVVHYYPLLEDYDIDLTTFIKFLIKLNKHHVAN